MTWNTSPRMRNCTPCPVVVHDSSSDTRSSAIRTQPTTLRVHIACESQPRLQVLHVPLQVGNRAERPSAADDAHRFVWC